MPIQLVSNSKRRPIFQIFSEIIQYIKSFTGSTTEANGSAGLVPPPLIADKDKFLKGDGTWATITETPVYQGATTDAPGVTGTVPAATASERNNFLRGDGTWGGVFTPAVNSNTPGTNGLVPASNTTERDQYFLKADATWKPVSSIGYPDAIKAAAAMTSGYFVVGSADGYRNIAAGVSFDISYPILLNMGANVTTGNYSSTLWVAMNNKRLSSTGFNMTVVKDKMCYIKGTLSGTTFTIDSTTPLTQDIPVSEDGKVYIPLGIANSTSTLSFRTPTEMFEYRDGAFIKYKGSSSIDPTTLVTIADNQEINGVKTFNKNTFGNTVALTGNSIDVSLANVFTKTVTGDITLTFTGVPTGKTAIFTLMLTNGGAYDVTFPNNIVWASDSDAPELKASGTDILNFFTPDGGTTWYDCGDSTNVYIGANSSADGIAGMVPPARYAQRDYFLKGDGTWAYVTENGMFTDFGGATDNANGRQGMVPAPYIADKNKFLRGDGTWYPINTYVGATTNTNGVAGLVPSALIADKEKFLRGDGTWQEVDIANMMTTDTVQTVTGAKTFGNTYGTIQSIDATSGEVFIDGTASTYVFTISTHTDIAFTATINPGQTKVFTLIINNTPSSNYAVYWPMNVYWNAATPPVLHDRDVITFMGIYNPLASRIEYYGTPSVIDAGTEAGVGGGSI